MNRTYQAIHLFNLHENPTFESMYRSDLLYVIYLFLIVYLH